MGDKYFLNEQQHKEEEKEFVHQNIDQICKNIMNQSTEKILNALENNTNDTNNNDDDQSNDIDVGFEDIYESIVAYEYDIKSLCDAILTEITSNDSLRDELEFAHRTSNDFKNQLKSLQSEYDQVMMDLHDKEHSMIIGQQKQNELMEVLNDYQLSHQQNQKQIQKLEKQIFCIQANIKTDDEKSKSTEIVNNASSNGNELDMLKDNDDQNLSPQELNVMRNQFVSMKNELKQNENKMMIKAAKQKKKYQRFVDKMKEQHIDTNDLMMSSDSDETDGDDDDEKFDIENEKNKLKNGGYDEIEAQKILSILTFEKCQIFRKKVVTMKKWIKSSKQNMRNLKTEFAENFKYLELQLTKLSEIKDDFYYQRGALMQQKKRLHQYVQDASHRINEQEYIIKGKHLEIEQLNKGIMNKTIELKQRESMLEQEKKDFDGMCRRYNQKKIDDELKNAEERSRRMLEIEKKERKVLSEMDDLEISKMYLTKEKNLYKKERELIHQQQIHQQQYQQQQQQDLINNDQTYIQREYIDAKDKFENDRYVLIDKINKLETENNKYQISEQTLTKQLSLKQDMCMLLEEQLDAMRKSNHQKEQEHNKLAQNEFISRQTIKNLKSEQTILNEKVQKLQNDEIEATQQNITKIKELEMDKINLQNENSVLLSDLNQMRDELEIYRAQKALIEKKKKKKISTKKPKKNTTAKVKKRSNKLRSEKLTKATVNRSKSKSKSGSKSKLKSKSRKKSRLKVKV